MSSVPPTHIADDRRAGVPGNLERYCVRERKKFLEEPTVANFPAVIHSKYFYESTSLLTEPYAPFAGKTVAVIGGGDSGKTIMEFLARIGPGSAAYGSGTVAKGSAKLIFVLGSFIEREIAAKRTRESKQAQPQTYKVGDPGKVTQKEYEEATRARYRPLGAKFPKDAAQPDSPTCPLVKGVAGRLNGMSFDAAAEKEKFTLKIDLNNQRGNLQLKADVVILATSLKPDYRLYEDSLLEGQAKIPESAERPPGRQRNSSPYAVVPAKKFKDTEIYFIGPGGGSYIRAPEDVAKLDAQGERLVREGKFGDYDTLTPEQRRAYGKTLGGVFDIAENAVSIFALGPISECTARLIAQTREPKVAATATAAADATQFEWVPGDRAASALEVAVWHDAAVLSLARKLNTAQRQQLVLFRLLLSLRGACTWTARPAAKQLTLSLSFAQPAKMMRIELSEGQFTPPAKVTQLLANDRVLGLVLVAALTEADEFNAVVKLDAQLEPDLVRSYMFVKPRDDVELD